MRRWFGWRGVVAGIYAFGLAIAVVPLGLRSAGGPPEGAPHHSSVRTAEPEPTPAPMAPPSPSAGGLSPADGAGHPGVGFAHVAYTTSSIPGTALAAYRAAATLIGRTDSSCHLEWPLLAAIGRVESDHGGYAGSRIDGDGEVSPPILGPVLNGAGDTALVPDTDNGRLDGDTRYDRAVGPMQFLPGTWSVVHADGNGDGVDDPENIFDAAVSAGRYLCAGDVDLSEPSQLRSAVYRYNHSDSYVSLVLTLADQYAHGNAPATLPTPSTATPPSPLPGHLPPATRGHGLEKHPSRHSGAPHPTGHGTTPSAHERSPHHTGPRHRSTLPPKTHTPGPGKTGNPSPSPKGKGSSPPGGSSSPAPKSPPPKPPSPSPTPTSPSQSPTPTSPTPTPEPPTVHPISVSGPVGAKVTIKGNRLGDATAFFGGSEADTVSSEQHALVVTAPARAAAGPVGVTVEGEDGEADAGTYTYVPNIENVEPSTGPASGGIEVTVTGTSLEEGKASFGDASADTKSSSDDGGTLVVTLPAHDAGEVDLVVSGGGETSEAADFAYQPVVSTLSPDSQEPGGDVTVKGEGFTDDSSITLTSVDENGEEVPDEATTVDTVTYESGNLTFTVPEDVDPGTYLLRVLTAGVASDPAELDVG
ncbi:MAG: IPT/TIG domain-containing protein [Streptosporangiaceae bacterium]